MRKGLIGSVTVAALLHAGPALACGGLVGDNGALELGKTTTLAAYVGGVEHYITGFSFAGAGGAFGSIVPLPGVPTKVEKAGDWTLQRLQLEVAPPQPEALLTAGAASADARVILETTVDSLDITVLEGGAASVGSWARENGFGLTPDAPEMLDFYARRSPIFMAVRFNAKRAAAQGLELGQATPVHVTVPTDNPWVPLRILALGKKAEEPVEADVFLLTERRPELLKGAGLSLGRSEPASELLLTDLASDDRMEWMPTEGMWFSHLPLSSPAGELDYDLAVDASGYGEPSRIDAGLLPPVVPLGTGFAPAPWLVVALVAAAAGAFTMMGRANAWR